MGFRFSFTPLPGFFSPFLHSTTSLSVTKEYLGLAGGPAGFPQGFSCPVVLWILPCVFKFRVRGFHPLWQAFPKPFHYPKTINYAVLNPDAPKDIGLPSFPFARRYLGNHYCFLFLSLLRCFSSRRFPSYAYGLGIG